MKGNKTLLLLACGVMDLSWFYAWADFLTLAVLKHSFPFPEAVGSFFLAAALTLFSSGRGWRVINIVALQALFLIPSLLRILDVFSSWDYALTHQAWLTSAFYSASASRNWLTFMLLILWLSPFWGGGMRLAWRALDYDTVCSRFDRGLVAFMMLLLAKFLFTFRGDIRISVPVFEYLIFAFFIFSLLAIGLVRNGTTTAVRDFIPGYQGIGVIFGFTFVVVLLCAGLTFFCLPFLTLAAEKSYVLLKSAAQPLGSLIMIIIHFIFGYPDDWKGKIPEKAPAKLHQSSATGQHSWWVEFLGRILAWGVWILLALIFLLILGVCIYFFVQWLFSKTDLEAGKSLPSHPLALWMEKLRLFLLDRWQRIRRSTKGFLLGYRGAVPLYGVLKRWGRRSGLPPFISETPAEYGRRLQQLFPQLASEIALIIDSFHKEVYGGIILEYRQLALTSSAWLKLRSPRHWPRRLKIWFFRRNGEDTPF